MNTISCYIELLGSGLRFSFTSYKLVIGMHFSTAVNIDQLSTVQGINVLFSAFLSDRVADRVSADIFYIFSLW